MQRSPDGRAWQPLGRVAATGHSAAPRRYTYTDAGAPAGLSYYRLHQLDLDGTAAYSPVRTVVLGAAPRLTAYPMPTRAGQLVQVAGAPAGQPLALLDVRGWVLATAAAPASGPATLRLPASLAPGVYVLRAGPQALRLLVE